MELSAYVEMLTSNLQSDFQEQKSSTPLSSVCKKISITNKCLRDLRSFVTSYKFTSQGEEVFFFKKQKPIFTSQLYYYKYLRNVTFFESLHFYTEREQFYNRMLTEIQNFLYRNKKHYLYLMSDRSDLDSIYFIRSSADSWPMINSKSYDSSIDKLTAIIQGKLLIREHLLKLLQPNSQEKLQGLDWSASKTDLIELIYALHTCKVFGKKTDLKEVVVFFENVFACELGQYSRTFLELRLRKKGQTKFLDDLRSALIAKIESLDR